MSDDELNARIEMLSEQMNQAAMELEFEQAAKLRDEIYSLKGISGEKSASSAKPGTPGSRRKARGRTRK